MAEEREGDSSAMATDQAAWEDPPSLPRSTLLCLRASAAFPSASYPGLCGSDAADPRRPTALHALLWLTLYA